MRLSIDDEFSLEKAGAIGKLIGGACHHRALTSAANEQQQSGQQDRETKHSRTLPIGDFHVALIGKPLLET